MLVSIMLLFWVLALTPFCLWTFLHIPLHNYNPHTDVSPNVFLYLFALITIVKGIEKGHNSKELQSTQANLLAVTITC